MFDHAAMGTLLIGLDAYHNETHAKRLRRPATTPRRQHTIRLVLANGLRRVAAQLQPQGVGELAEKT
jgi:hypothetical protein